MFLDLCWNNIYFLLLRNKINGNGINKPPIHNPVLRKFVRPRLLIVINNQYDTGLIWLNFFEKFDFFFVKLNLFIQKIGLDQLRLLGIV